MKIILASGSPRRSEILKNLGLEFQVVLPDVDESSDVTDPCALTEELSRRKGLAVYTSLGEPCDTLIISSDTVVAIDGEILGKPRDLDDAERMLRKLSGRAHEVVSGICLTYNGRAVSAHEVTRVVFGEMTDKDVETAVTLGAPLDKAGAYAIQGIASLFIKGLDGDYFNVVGFPVNLFARTLKEELGINICDYLK